MAATDRAAAARRVLQHGCGLIDRSERGKLALTGGDAAGLLQGQVTNDVEALEPGTGCYAAFLTPKGKMLGDLRILNTGEELWLDTERVALQALFNQLRRATVGHDAELHKRTLERGLVSLEGPRSRAIAPAGDLPETEHANRPGEIGGVAVLTVVTPTGVDLICDAGDVDDLVAALVEAGAEPVPEEAAEALRVEAGRPRYGIDLDETVIPQEAGLNSRAVSFTKGCYVGQETVARLFYKGKPNRHLRGLRLSAPANRGEALRLAGKPVGTVGSVADSPAHGPIALAIVRREAAPGALVEVGEGGARAEVVELPFSEPPADAAG